MITADPRATSHELRMMVAHGQQPTPHELLMVAALLDILADQNPNILAGKTVDLRRAFAVIQGGKDAH